MEVSDKERERILDDEIYAVIMLLAVIYPPGCKEVFMLPENLLHKKSKNGLTLHLLITTIYKLIDHLEILMKKIIPILIFVFMIAGCEWHYDKEGGDGLLSREEWQELLGDLNYDANHLEIPEAPLNTVTDEYEISPATNTLTLTSIGERGTDVTWHSMNTAVITDDGIVLSHPTGTYVTLIGFVSKHGINDSKTFYILFL